MVLLCLFLPALEYNIEVQSSFHTLNANIETSCWVLVLLIIIVTPETGICISNWCGYSSGNSALTFICLRAVLPPRFHDPGAIWAEQRPCYVIYKTKKHQGEMQHFTLSDKVYRLYYLNTEDPTPHPHSCLTLVWFHRSCDIFHHPCVFQISLRSSRTAPILHRMTDGPTTLTSPPIPPMRDFETSPGTLSLKANSGIFQAVKAFNELFLSASGLRDYICTMLWTRWHVAEVFWACLIRREETPEQTRDMLRLSLCLLGNSFASSRLGRGRSGNLLSCEIRKCDFSFIFIGGKIEKEYNNQIILYEQALGDHGKEI